MKKVPYAEKDQAKNSGARCGSIKNLGTTLSLTIKNLRLLVINALNKKRILENNLGRTGLKL
jgi:hypothetical protein